LIDSVTFVLIKFAYIQFICSVCSVTS